MPGLQKGVKMDENNIREYAELMRELGLTGLEIREKGKVMRLERTPRPGTEARDCFPDKSGPAPEAFEEDYAGLAELCSPMVGVFYCAPAEDSEPFVKLGDAVRKGDVVCVIESMKLMNEIMADEDGTIADICAENGQIVDFGHVLFRIRKERA